MSHQGAVFLNLWSPTRTNRGPVRKCAGISKTQFQHRDEPDTGRLSAGGAYGPQVFEILVIVARWCCFRRLAVCRQLGWPRAAGILIAIACQGDAHTIIPSRR